MPTESTIYSFGQTGGEVVTRTFDAHAAAALKADAATKKYFATLAKGPAVRVNGALVAGGTGAVGGSSLGVQVAELKAIEASLPRVATGINAVTGSITRANTATVAWLNNTRALGVALAAVQAQQLRALPVPGGGGGGAATGGTGTRTGGGRPLIFGRLGSGPLSGRASLGGGGLGVAGGVALGGAIGLGVLAAGEESYNRLERAAGLYATSQADVNQSIEDLRRLAVQSYTPLDEVTRRYQRLGVIQEQLGANRGQVLTLLQAAADAERLQGGRTASTSAGINQLIQGFTSGRLGGDELRSLRENIPRLAQAIADGLSEIRGERIGIGDLRRLSERGQLNSIDAINALLLGSGNLRGQASALDPLLGEEFQNLKTQFGLLNQDLGNLVGPSGLLSLFVRNLAESIAYLRGLLPEQDGNSGAFTNIETIKAVGVALATSVESRENFFNVPLKELFRRSVEEGLRARNRAAPESALSAPDLLDPRSQGFTFRGIRLAPNESLQRFLEGIDATTYELGRFALDIQEGGLEFAQRQQRFNQFIGRFNELNGERLNPDSPLAGALQDAFNARETNITARRQALFNFDLNERLDATQRQLELQQSLVGATDQERAAKESLFSLEAQARRANVELLDEHRERAESLARAAQRQREVEGALLDFARAGTDFTRDLLLNFQSLDQAALSFIGRIGEMILELTLFAAIQRSLTTFFNPVASAVVPSAHGNVFNSGRVVPFASGGIIGAPVAFPMRGGQTGLAGEAGPEAIVPLQRDSKGNLGVSSSGGTVMAAVMSDKEIARAIRSGSLDDEIASRINARGQRSR